MPIVQLRRVLRSRTRMPKSRNAVMKSRKLCIKTVNNQSWIYSRQKLNIWQPCQVYPSWRFPCSGSVIQWLLCWDAHPEIYQNLIRLITSCLRSLQIASITYLQICLTAAPTSVQQHGRLPPNRLKSVSLKQITIQPFHYWEV